MIHRCHFTICGDDECDSDRHNTSLSNVSVKCEQSIHGNVLNEREKGIEDGRESDAGRLVALEHVATDQYRSRFARTGVDNRGHLYGGQVMAQAQALAAAAATAQV